MNKLPPKFLLPPASLPPIRAAAPSPLPGFLPAVVAILMIMSIFATMLGLAVHGVGLVEW
jgi:hypothetical protein